MRHAAVTFAEQLRSPGYQVQRWDALFCTDMLNLAEFRGLSHRAVYTLPTIAYFHENQLTYPNRENHERDLQYAFTNLTTCIAADAVWFNSAYHRDIYLSNIASWMRRMPDYQLTGAAEGILEKSSVHWPGVDLSPRSSPRSTGPIRILWASRWEHDKNPQVFFDSLRILQQERVPFRVKVLGESFGRVPTCFSAARDQLSQHIDHWGYASRREEYIDAVRSTDVVVSTALHEFFGIGVVEAVAVGNFPLVPRALAYPEVIGDDDDYFHDGSARGIAARLAALSQRLASTGSCWAESTAAAKIVGPYGWATAARRMDQAVEQVCADKPTSD